MKTCLVIVFNHRYESNLQALRRLYEKRFSQIRFLMPFYAGSDPDVISVYESSYQFQGFFAQSRKELLKVECDYYFIISDDLILNPILNEYNFLPLLSVESGETLISTVFSLNKSPWDTIRLYENINAFDASHTLFQHELMPKDEAFRIMEANFFGEQTISFRELKNKSYKRYFIRKFGLLNLLRFYRRKQLPYPLVGGYSDWFILPREDFEIVSEKLGVTAAMGLFVEIAIPTIIMLYCKKVKYLNQTPYKEGAIWNREEMLDLENMYNKDLNILLEDFPKEKLYIHPIKLSKWKYL